MKIFLSEADYLFKFLQLNLKRRNYENNHFAIIHAIGANLFAKQLAPTETEALVKILVSDFKNIPRKNDMIILSAAKTAREYQCVTDNAGYAEVLLPKGDTYLISYKTISKEEKYNSLTIPQISGLITSTITIKYEPAKTITLENVYFDSNQSSIKPVSFKSLDDLVSFMKLKPDLVVEIAGHTDNIGDELSNKVLSQSRAEAVRNYLIKKGIPAERIVAKGYGEEEPVAGNDDEAGRQQNRRTEIRIISE